MAKQEISTTPRGRKELSLRGKRFRQTMVRGGLVTTIVLGGLAAGAKIVVDKFGDDFRIIPIGQTAEEAIKQIEPQTTRQIVEQIIEQNIRNGAYQMDVPPGREAENLLEIPTATNKKDIPNISEDTFPSSVTSSIAVGFDAFPEGRWIMSAKKGEEMRESLIPPFATVSGYLVAKERQPDGSILFAIELPYSDSPRDILKRDTDVTVPQTTTKTRRSSGFENAKSFEQTTVQGVIVWVRLFDGTNPTHYPFNTPVVWEEGEFQTLGITGGIKAGYGAKPLAEYAGIGYPIRANIPLSLDPDSANISAGLDKYVNRYHHGDDIDELKRQLEQIAENNMKNAQKLINDSGQSVYLEDQLANKGYVFTADIVVFLPK